jgi:hypothetical protein
MFKSKKSFSSKDKNIFTDFSNIEKFGNFYNFVYKNFKSKNEILFSHDNYNDNNNLENKFTFLSLVKYFFNKFTRDEKFKGKKEKENIEFKGILFNSISTKFYRSFNDFSSLFFIKTSTKIMEIYSKIIILETNGIKILYFI